MIRETLEDGSKFVAQLFMSSQGPILRERTETAGTVNQKPYPKTGEKAPYWVKVSRQGNTFTGYISADGKQWKEIRSVEVSMAKDCYAGITANSHAADATGIYSFSNVTLNQVNPAKNIGQNAFTIYPNPASGYFVITQNIAKEGTVKIYDLNGKVVLTQNLQIGNTRVSTSKLLKGTYIVHINGCTINKKQYLVIL